MACGHRRKETLKEPGSSLPICASGRHSVAWGPPVCRSVWSSGPSFFVKTFAEFPKACMVGYLVWEGPLAFGGTCFTDFRCNIRVWVVGVTGREGILASCGLCRTLGVQTTQETQPLFLRETPLQEPTEPAYWSQLGGLRGRTASVFASFWLPDPWSPVSTHSHLWRLTT